MKGWVLAIGLGLALLPAAAKAADLEEGPPPPRYGGTPYDDDRYSDVYRYPVRPPVPPAGVYRDDYPAGPGYERYPERGERYSGRGGCVPRHVVRDRLVRDGWHDFQEGELRGEVVTLHARRDGRAFMLAIDRCSGEVVQARPAYQPGPYAYGPPGRRYERPYY